MRSRSPAPAAAAAIVATLLFAAAFSLGGCGSPKEEPAGGQEEAQAVHEQLDETEQPGETQESAEVQESAEAQQPLIGEEQATGREGASKTVVQTGDKVTVHYKGTLSDGSVFDESTPDRPLIFTVGEGRLIPGFENAVIGMKLDEVKTVTIPPDQAYGERDVNLVRSAPKSMLPQGMAPEVGQMIRATGAGGRMLQGEIVEVSQDSVRIDFNHPLAGKDLTFEIKVVAIE